MRVANNRRIAKHLLLVLAVVAVGVFAGSCRNNEVEVPPLTGPSGHTLFLTMQAAPDHLVIHAPGRPRETSQITLQLKNQQGVGVPGENVKLRIANRDLQEINIGRLSDYNVTTDSAGFARVIYTAPDSAEQTLAISVYVLAILTNPNYPYEVTDKHELDLETSAVQPGTCIFGSPNAPVPSFTITPNPATIANPVCFDASATTDNTLPIVAFSWDFGDGTKGSGEVVCHEYGAEGSFPVRLLVQDEDHNCEDITQTVVVERGEPASCTIIVSPATADINETVNFTAQIDDPDGQVRKFSWNFGDGSKSSTSRNTASHSYSSAGTFTVLLTIVDDQGNVSYCQATVTVTSNPPDCNFTANPTSGNSPLTVTFDSSASTDDTGIASRTWAFGDGGTGSGTIVTHIFVATCDNTATACQDTFTVALTVEDEDGNQSTCSQQVIVSRPVAP